MYGHDAPKHWTVPVQRATPPRQVPLPIPPPVPAARDGHHDWGAVVAVLAALIALAALVGPGPSVTDGDRTPASASTAA